jgi:pSer/pThr/pTyr-binding forkhead associated (FHA) protein
MVTEFPRVFGRADFKAYVTDSRFISRRHFTIFREGYAFYIRDGAAGRRRWASSTNGTLLNGIELQRAGRHELKEGDKVLVSGTFAITFQIRA